jgi:hypothetical protein
MESVIFNAAVWGILVPATLTGLLMLVEQPPWRVTSEADTPFGFGWAGALTYPLGLVIAFVGTGGAPKNIPALAFVAAILGLIEFGLRTPTWARWLARLVAITTIMFALIGFQFENYWETLGQDLLWGGTIVAVTALLFETLDRVGRNRPGATLPLTLMVLAAGTAGYFALVGTARIAQMIGALAAVAGAATVVALWNCNTRLAPGGTTAWGLLYAGLTMTALFSLFELPPLGPFALLLVAPHLVWIGDVGPLKKLRGWKSTSLRVALVGAATAAALGWTQVMVGGGGAY